jgi:hypothetical protein
MRVIEFILILTFAIICVSIYNFMQYLYTDVMNDTQRGMIIFIYIMILGIYYCYFDNRELNLHIL